MTRDILFADSLSQLVVNAENPWPGLAAFREQDQEFYRGRGRETDELFVLVRRPSQLAVFFGPSGLGKTSLLQAGLFPRLRKENYLPVFIRIDYSLDSVDPITQIRALLTSAARANDVEAPPFHAEDTLWESFHREDAGFWSRRNEPITPVLVFDQFEELFTLGAGRADDFIEQLGDLIEGRTPDAVRARLENRPDDVQQFAFDRHRYKVILSLREDFLADLEGLRPQIPAIAHNRLRLRPLSGAQALEIVLGAGDRLVGEPIAERIIRFVAGEPGRHNGGLAKLEIEPALLSLVCRELNNSRLKRGASQITADQLEVTGTKILDDFYRQCFDEIKDADVVDATRRFVEERLLTSSGYRDSVALDNVPSAVTSEVLNTLVNRRLLRLEERVGVRRIELTHDVLTGVIRASRDNRRLREEQAQAHRAKELAERKLWRTRAFAVVVLVLAAGSGVSAWLAVMSARRAREGLARAEAAERQAQLQVLRGRAESFGNHRSIAELSGMALAPRDPKNNAYLHFRRAYSSSHTGQRDTAIAEYTLALRANPEFHYARVNRCDEYLNEGDVTRAIADCERAVRRVPHSFIPHMNLAIAYGLLGDYVPADSAFHRSLDATQYARSGMGQSTVSPTMRRVTGRTTLALEAEEIPAALLYGIAAIKAYGGLPGFQAALTAADNAHPTEEAVLNGLYWTWLQSKNRPEDYGAFAVEGSLWERLGQKSEAARAYREFQSAFEKSDASAQGRYALLKTWVEQRLEGKGAPPQRASEMLVSRRPLLEAQELDAAGRRDSALRLLNAAIDSAPNPIDLLLGRIAIWSDSAVKTSDTVAQFVALAAVREDANRILGLADKLGYAYFWRAWPLLWRYWRTPSFELYRTEIMRDLDKSLASDSAIAGALIWQSRMLSESDPRGAYARLKRARELMW